MIPWCRWGGELSLDHALAWGMVLSWSGLLASRLVRWENGVTISSLMVILFLAGSLLLDQHRLQVWAWEFFWLTMFWTCCSARTAVLCSRLLVLSIYFFSAISKFDRGFVETQGPWLWEGFVRALGFVPGKWESGASWVFLIFPSGEFLIAVTLMLRRWRRMGIVLSGLMHLTLLVMLGPLGHRQHPGVLLWNLYFLATVPVLFWRVEPVPVDVQQRRQTGDGWGLLVVLLLGIWPALEGMGWCDHWPAWAVYSSRPEIVRIDVHDSDVHKLPPGLQLHVGPSPAFSEWRPVSIDQWSFQERSCPVYPQGRYRLAVARYLEDRYRVRLQVSVQATLSRWSGKRDKRDVSDLNQECDTYFWNTAARAPRVLEPVMPGQWIISLTAQIAVGLYLLRLFLRRPRERASTGDALFWTGGWIALMGHTIAAFHYLHRWDHTAALSHTARRTAEVTGWNWSGGLYINYLFLAFWLSDVLRLWGETRNWWRPTGARWECIIQGVFAFMMFNATVIFGPAHWIVVALACAVCYTVVSLRRLPDATGL